MTRAVAAAAVALVAAVAVVGIVLSADGAQPAGADRWTALRPASLERTEVAAARVGRFAYVVGGFERASGRTTTAVERYDLRRDRWRSMRPMPIALNHATAVSYRGRLYVHGATQTRPG